MKKKERKKTYILEVLIYFWDLILVSFVHNFCSSILPAYLLPVCSPIVWIKTTVKYELVRVMEWQIVEVAKMYELMMHLA